MTVEKIKSGKRYERGMRYKLSFCNGDHAQYLTEMAFLELRREIIQLQNKSSNNKYTASQATPKSCPKCGSASILKNEKFSHYGCLKCHHEWA